jgi:hypothetical protein
MDLGADFSIDVSPASATTAAGGSVVYTLSAKTSGGFSSPLTLDVAGRPAGTSFSNPAWTGSVAITVSTSQATPPGTYPLTINATGGGITHSSPVSLVVTANSPQPPPPTTTTPTPAPTPTPKPPVPIESVSNGCGGDGLGKLLLHAQNWAGNSSTYYDSNVNPLARKFTVSFKYACDLHDAGYSGATVVDRLNGGKITDFSTWTKRQVDDAFLRNMETLCKRVIPKDASVALHNCEGRGGHFSLGASSLYIFVVQYGQSFFDAARSSAPTPTPTPAPSKYPFDGTWTGTFTGTLTSVPNDPSGRSKSEAINIPVTTRVDSNYWSNVYGKNASGETFSAPGVIFSSIQVPASGTIPDLSVFIFLSAGISPTNCRLTLQFSGNNLTSTLDCQEDTDPGFPTGYLVTLTNGSLRMTRTSKP